VVKFSVEWDPMQRAEFSIFKEEWSGIGQLE